MKLVPVLLVLVCSLLVTGQAGAERWAKQLKKDKTGDQMYSFTVKVEPLQKVHSLWQIEDVGEFLEFHVTVKPVATAEQLEEARRQGWRPQFWGELRIFDGKKFVSACKLQPTRRGEELSFNFQVAAKYAESAGFTFAQTEGEEGDGGYYWFYLEEFVETK